MRRGWSATDDLRQLLIATTKAGAKTVLVGDAHQLAPVKARGGMFAQLCGDLPWTQNLSEVWRMRNDEERTASLALRDGDREQVRKALDWYCVHDRLHTGDPIAMAHDALAGYQRDVAVGKDALPLCDTTEMADALNRRIHDDTITPDAPTVTAARGHRIATGDLILTRRNNPTIEVWEAADRDTDHACAVFGPDYVREPAPTGMPPRCTPRKASPRTPPTRFWARAPPARCST